jgi:hypothetical protein
MCSSVSKEQKETRPEAVGDTHSANIVGEDIHATENSAAQISGYRFLQAVQRIARLQRHTINTQIDARQKRREIGFKRRDVWDCDADFMKELQSLIGQEKLKEFPKLSKLAEQCQAARDDLGPLEEEGTMAELRLEGEIWKLQEAEKSVYAEFGNEFEPAESYTPEPSSTTTSLYESPPDGESQKFNETGKHNLSIIPRSLVSSSSFPQVPPEPELSPSLDDDDVHQDSMLLGLNNNDSRPLRVEELYIEYSVSGIEDIDNPPRSRTTVDTIGPFHPLPSRAQASAEPYPQLVTDFGSRRDRINKWLQHMMLVSPLESAILLGILQDQLNPKGLPIPSNWSQLVIAYWELDGGTTPNVRLKETAEGNLRH